MLEVRHPCSGDHRAPHGSWRGGLMQEQLLSTTAIYWHFPDSVSFPAGVSTRVFFHATQPRNDFRPNNLACRKV